MEEITKANNVIIELYRLDIDWLFKSPKRWGGMVADAHRVEEYILHRKVG